MEPVFFLIVGLLIIWLVFTGRALAVWESLTAGQVPEWAEPGAPVTTPTVPGAVA